jgi:predicted aspartyl protease
MKARTATATKERPRLVGKVTATISIANRLDEGMAQRGVIPADEVRRVTIEEALVDTGATLLCLPQETIDALGLEAAREVQVTTASGPMQARLYRDAHLFVHGRDATFECIALPGGSTPLLGVIPLEALGLQPDLVAQRLLLLPEEGRDNYLTVL